MVHHNPDDVGLSGYNLWSSLAMVLYFSLENFSTVLAISVAVSALVLNAIKIFKTLVEEDRSGSNLWTLLKEIFWPKNKTKKNKGGKNNG